NSMAEQNVPAQPPTRTDEQIVPRSQWLTIGKSNLLFNVPQKSKRIPSFRYRGQILKNTTFFNRIDCICKKVPGYQPATVLEDNVLNEKKGFNSCQLDEQWFD
ncbi:hypothetical protein Tco_0732511, partial [Tanacetum coccineum]